MFDRHWLGDLALAIAVALPLGGLTIMQPAPHHPTEKSTALTATADRSPGGRIGLLG